ncbi:hypothetical protein C0584_01995 [Candidatus Parcubacteria bacterium]|nr:MAG: hypothetical protein C0584_01995 [Candidatus Parcubacteria bacterium]
MKKGISIIVLFVFALSFVGSSFALESQVQVVHVKPHVYTKIVMVENDNAIVGSAAAGFGAGAAGGAAIGTAICPVVGTVIGILFGGLAGMGGGTAAGVAIADEVEKEVRVDGYMVELDNGQVFLTEKCYEVGQRIDLPSLVYDRTI